MDAKTPKGPKRPTLHAAPMLITDVFTVHWSNGLLFVNVERGPEPGCIAVSPHVACRLAEVLRRAICADEASPLRQPNPPVKLHKGKDAKP